MSDLNGFQEQKTLVHNNGSVIYFLKDKKNAKGYDVIVPNGIIHWYTDVTFEHSVKIAKRGS